VLGHTGSTDPGDFLTTGDLPLRPLAAALVAFAAAAVCASSFAATADAPRITDAGMSPRRFAVDPRGPAEVQAGVSRGTTLHYQLSKKADVFFFLDRGTRGRMVGGRCHRQSKRNRRHKSCAFYVRSGSFKQAGTQGLNTKIFSGRIGRHGLRPAHYKVTLVAVDDTGSPSTPGTVLRFTVLRG